jgi:hypothetical protein
VDYYLGLSQVCLPLEDPAANSTQTLTPPRGLPRGGFVLY